MFWKYNFVSSTQIETLLQKEDVTLSELMDEDELLQECKAQNKRLIDFLTRADVLDELVYLVVSEPSADSELRMRFKYANLAAELLTADVPAIIDKLVASTGLLDILYKFLKQDKPLNPLLASFFSKVLGMLVQRRSEQNWYSYQFTCFQVLDFLKSKGDFVELAVHHVGTSAIMDLLLRLICNVEEEENRQSVHQWLNECRLVEQLVGRLSPEADPDEHSSVDNILLEISSICREPGSDTVPPSNPLLAALESEETINKMLDLLLHEERSESSLSHVINVLLTLLAARSPLHIHSFDPNQHDQIHIHNQQQNVQKDESGDQKGNVECRRNVVAQTIAKRLPNLHNNLLNPPMKGLLLTAYGGEVERLGSTRLQVVTLVAALVTTNDLVVHTALCHLNTIHHLLDLFFKFTLNNFLHTQVQNCLTVILSHVPAPSCPQDSSDHPLLTQLFTQCRIIQRLLAAYQETTESHDGKQIHNTRGYMGHLREVANTIVQQLEFGPNEHRIKQLIQELPEDNATKWKDFVSSTLAEVNLKNEITPIQGFKDMNMDVIGDFCYGDNGFKDPEDNLSGPLQRLTTQTLALSGGGAGGSPGGPGGEDEVGDQALFEEMCSSRCADPNLEDVWSEKEKQITFTHTPSTERVEESGGLSSDEEEEEEEDFSNLRSEETKMEVDQEEWAEVFDKRGGLEEGSDGANPWQSAPMSDTSDNSGWADFGTFSSSATPDPFGQPRSEKPSFAPDFSSVFGSPGEAGEDTQGHTNFPTTLSSQSPNPEAFKSDFSSLNFDTAFKGKCESQKPITSSSSPPPPSPSTDTQTSGLEEAECGVEESREEKVEEKEKEEEQEDLADNFYFLSSCGLMKSGEEKGTEAGMAVRTDPTTTTHPPHHHHPPQEGEEKVVWESQDLPAQS